MGGAQCDLQFTPATLQVTLQASNVTSDKQTKTELRHRDFL